MAWLVCPRSRAACRMWIMAESAPSLLTNIGSHHHHPHQHHCQLIIGFSNSTFIFIIALMTLFPWQWPTPTTGPLVSKHWHWLNCSLMACWTTSFCTQEQKALTLFCTSTHSSVLTFCTKHTSQENATENGPIIQGKSDHRSLKCPPPLQNTRKKFPLSSTYECRCPWYCEWMTLLDGKVTKCYCWPAYISGFVEAKQADKGPCIQSCT